MKGNHYDTGKPRMELLPPHGLMAVARAFSYGAGKYGDWNYRNGIQFSKLIGSTLRHITTWNGGESVDKESGECHLSHAAANLMMILQGMRDNPELDDRFKKPIKEGTDAKVLADDGIDRGVCGWVCGGTGNVSDGSIAQGELFIPNYGC